MGKKPSKASHPVGFSSRAIKKREERKDKRKKHKGKA